jgi:hypothetical protein
MKTIAVTAALLLMVLAWFGYDYYSRQHSCDAVFEQSAPSLKASLGIIDVKGDVTIGRQQVQALTESSQKVGLTLRNCCIAHQQGDMSENQYRTCIGGAKTYEAQVHAVKNNVERAQQAQQDRNPERAAEYSTQAKRMVQVAISTVPIIQESIPPPAETISPPQQSSAVPHDPWESPKGEGTARPPSVTNVQRPTDAAIGGGPQSPSEDEAHDASAPRERSILDASAAPAHEPGGAPSVRDAGTTTPRDAGDGRP